ncbi:MAG: GTPase [Micavibrio aeruginosavorus]|uniref:Flagellar biosynthesis protein FlhF n=1 Tax=Micavibrio aeruginosavorus TaxID=349221 RepID=A0A2W5FM50_9BACT|nr:MAG: GTPase [Micavibrio aeruginosavorus]
MRLKSFYAKTMAEAMQLVREALGEDAIIIATREEQGGKSVRVTAAVEDEKIAFDLNKGATADDWLQYDDEEMDDDNLSEALIDVMLKHVVSEEVMDQVVSCASVMGVDDPHVALVGAFDTLFNFTPLPQKAYKKALMFVGPPGAGKTLSLVKQATRCVMEDLDVAIITTDTSRAGGLEQLQAFTKLLQIDLKRARNAKELSAALSGLQADQILIDTAGLNPFDREDMKLLAQLIAAGDIEPVLVLPAAMDSSESGEIARVFSALGARRLVPTRLDMARRLGGLISAAHQGGLSFADAGIASQVADGLTPLTPRILANYFMPNKTVSTISEQAKNTSTKRRTRRTG